MLPSHVQATARCTLGQHLIDLQRLGEALEEWRAERLAGKEAPQELPGRRTDHQRIGRGEPLQAGRQVGRLAQRQLFLPRTAAHLPHHHQPGMDPQAHGELHPPLLPQAGIELAHGLDHAQPGAHGPLGVIFVRQRVAKVDQQAIAEVLRDMPLKAGDHLRTRVLIGPHHLAQLFRVELAGEHGRVDQVTEQHSELAPFRVRGRRDRGRGCDRRWLLVRYTGRLDRLGRLRRWCAGPCDGTRPDQAFALVIEDRIYVEQLFPENIQVLVIQVEPYLQGAIRHPALALEERNHLCEDVVKGHVLLLP